MQTVPAPDGRGAERIEAGRCRHGVRMRIAIIDHSYHATTKSTRFFDEILEGLGTVRRFHEESWCGGSNDWRSHFNENDYDLIVVWQAHEAFSRLSGKHDNVVFVPMYDAMVGGTRFYWRNKFSHAKCLSFSRRLHEEVTKRGALSAYFQYFPDPTHYPQVKDFSEVRPFFWYRSGVIDTSLVFDLCAGTKIKNMTLHNAPDPGKPPLAIAKFPPNIANFEVSTWFDSIEHYRAALVRNNVFFASRAREGIGMAFLEAMACGLCVVAPDFPTMNEYITSGSNGLLYCLRDRSALDFTRAAEIGARARETVARGHAEWQDALPRLLDFIATPKSRLAAPKVGGLRRAFSNAGRQLRQAGDKIS